MKRGPAVPLLFIVGTALLAVLGSMLAGNKPQLGLDLQGGASVVLRPKNDVSTGALNQAIEIIRNRVDALGVVEPDISRQGSNIIVQLPGVKDQQRALDLVGDTAELRFRPVLTVLGAAGATTTTTAAPGATTSAPADSTTTAPANPATLRLAQADTTTTAPTTAPADTTPTTPPPSAPAAGPCAPEAPAATLRLAQADTTTTAPTTAPAEATTTTTAAAPAADIPTTPRDQDLPEAQVVLEDKDGETRYLLGPCELTGKSIKSATAQFDTGGWLVRFTLTGDGSPLFDEVAARNVGKQLAIVLDGVVQSAPTIQQAEFKGEGQITGSFSEREAKDLALVLRYGALPVELQPETVETVSASLGRDSLRAGIAAGLVGLGLVLLYMILYYRALGVVVILGLGVWGALMWSIVSLLGSTSGLALSLSGAVGIIISVGVTVDSYVVYFERLKDDVRAGKTIRSSVDRSFSRAFRTILAADISSFIGASLLYLLTVGSVRGFAFFLGLSTILDVVVAYFFTRPLVMLLGRNRVFTEARWLGVARGLAVSPAGGA